MGPLLQSCVSTTSLVTSPTVGGGRNPTGLSAWRVGITHTGGLTVPLGRHCPWRGDRQRSKARERGWARHLGFHQVWARPHETSLCTRLKRSFLT